MVLAGAAVGRTVSTWSTSSAATQSTTATGNGGPGGPGGGDLAPQAGPLTGDGSDGYTSRAAAASLTTSATARQERGVVDINVTLGYQDARAAATGIVLTSTGEILTNNHVVDGATAISVTVVSTGRTYSASVVGYDITGDIAVIQLKGASGLATANTAARSTVAVGAKVVGVGNAGGVGGTPRAAAGHVVAVNQTITASDQSGANAEQLTGLIETNAAIAAGDSGGPLYDASGKVVGIDTAASSGGQAQGYAIPIARALAIAAAIESGASSSTVHIGTTAMLGVEVAGTSQTFVQAVLAGSPAARAGVVAGDQITVVAGRAVTTPTSLSSIVDSLTSGQRVSLHWTDRAGTAHRATVTLMNGPAL
jgi:S1-C subfamily serine protease